MVPERQGEGAAKGTKEEIKREIDLVRERKKREKGKEMKFGDSVHYYNYKKYSALFLVILVVLSCSVFCELGFCSKVDSIEEMALVGDIRDSEGVQNSAEIESLAKFAVDEHNKKENALLEFARVVKAKEQVVAGTLHHLTLEVIDAGKKKIYEAKVWVKPWLNFKELQEFKHAGDSPASFTPSDLGVKREGHAPGWRAVPADDPVVKDAANHALKTIQQRSNSLATYELLEILLAKAEVIEEFAKFDMLLKVKRGGKEEKYKVEVHKNNEGTFHLNQMEHDCS